MIYQFTILAEKTHDFFARIVVLCSECRFCCPLSKSCTKKCQFLCEDSFIVTVCMHTATIIIDHLVETFISFPKKESVLVLFRLFHCGHCLSVRCVIDSVHEDTLYKIVKTAILFASLCLQSLQQFSAEPECSLCPGYSIFHLLHMFYITNV